MNTPHAISLKKEKMAGEAFFACQKTGIDKRQIKVLYETPAQELILNEKGEVIGTIARRGNKKIAFKARRAVVLTSGAMNITWPCYGLF